MFKARLGESALLKSGIDAVAQLITETTLNLSNEGIRMTAMDAANVSLIDLSLSKSAFESFELDKEQSIGVSLEDLTRILKRAKADQPIDLTLTDENRLEIVINGKRKFDIPLLDLGSKPPKKPNLSFAATIDFKISLLEDAIADTEIVSDAITFETGKDTLNIFAEGDGRKVEINLNREEEAILDINSKEAVSSMFPIDYLRKISKGAKMADSATLFLGKDYPLKLELRDKDSKFELSYILAPRIENE